MSPFIGLKAGGRFYRVGRMITYYLLLIGTVGGTGTLCGDVAATPAISLPVPADVDSNFYWIGIMSDAQMRATPDKSPMD